MTEDCAAWHGVSTAYTRSKEILHGRNKHLYSGHCWSCGCLLFDADEVHWIKDDFCQTEKNPSSWNLPRTMRQQCPYPAIKYLKSIFSHQSYGSRFWLKDVNILRKEVSGEWQIATCRFCVDPDYRAGVPKLLDVCSSVYPKALADLLEQQPADVRLLRLVDPVPTYLAEETDMLRGKGLVGYSAQRFIEGQKTVVRWSDRHLEEKMFPWLFVKGRGGWQPSHGVTYEHYAFMRLTSVATLWSHCSEYATFVAQRAGTPMEMLDDMK